MRFRWTAYILAALLGSASLTSALELKDKTFNTENAGKVVFSHTLHLKKKNAKSANVGCKACHNGNMRDNVRYTMADMDKGKSCGICHNGKKAFALAKCTACHKVREVTFKVKETGPVLFSHTRHLKTMQCGACHSKLFKTGPNKRVDMAQMERGKSCGACHNGKKAFALGACTKCHPVKEKNYKVADAGNVTFSHKIHIDMYRCQECHNKLYIPGSGNRTVSMAEMEAGKSCGACHDSKTAFTVKENCDKCHRT